MNPRRRITITLTVAFAAVALVLGVGIIAGKMVLARHLSYSHASLSLHRAVFDDLVVRVQGRDAAFSARRLDVAYNLRDLLIGGKRAFGLVSVDATAPRVTLVHYADGTWNVPMPQGTPQPAPSIAPMVFRATIRDGTITVDDRTRIHPRSRFIDVESVNADAAIDQYARSTYRVSAVLRDEGTNYPVLGRAMMDDPRGIELNRWTAAALPVTPLIDYVLNTKGLSVADGMLRDVDARYFGLRGPKGTIVRHLSARGVLDGLRVYLGSVVEPIRDLNGPVYAYDDGITIPHATGTLAGMPLEAAGGVFDLAAPELRIGARAQGTLAQAARLSPVVAKAGVSGNFGLSLFVEGAAQTPLILARLDSQSIRYKTYPIHNLHALAALSGTEADLISARAGYGPISLYASARTLLDVKRAYAQGFANVTAPSSALPYAGAILPNVALNVTAVGEGRADAFSAAGLVDGTNGDSSISGTLAFAPNGNGSIGPLEVTRRGASLYARISVDRRHGDEVALADLRNFPVRIAQTAARFNGGGAAQLHGKQLISAGGTLDGSVADGSLLALAAFDHGNGRARVALHGLRLRGKTLEASSSVSLRGSRLSIDGATVNYGGALAMLNGNAENVLPGGKTFAPRYDVRAHVLGVDLASLGAILGRKLPPLEGNLDATMRVAGTGHAPNVSGSMAIPAGFVNGLGFRDATVALRGTPGALQADDGRVTVGSTTIAFDGAYGGGGLAFAARAPHLDLADFDDYFDVGDSLAGRGSMALSLRLGAGGGGVGSDGSVALQGARYRSIPLGTANATWHSSNGAVVADASLGGRSGSLGLSGSVLLPSSDPARDTIRRSALNLHATAHRVDLSAYLPAAGIALPVTGFLDAQATVHGRYPDVSATAHASLAEGTIGRMRVNALTVDGNADRGAIHIAAARFESDHLTVTASGLAGLRANDPLDLRAQADVDDLGALYREAMGGVIDASGRMTATVAIAGTRLDPVVHPVLSFDDLRYQRFAVPHAAADFTVDRKSALVRSAEVDFTRGRLVAEGSVPFSSAPLGLQVGAQAIDLSSFAPLMQQGTHLAGLLDGTVDVRGTRDAPQLGGSLALTRGHYDSPAFQTPLTAMTGSVAFEGNDVRLERFTAKAGGGTLALDGDARLADLRAPIRDLSFKMNANLQNVTLDLPAYFKGRVNANLTASRAAGASGEVAGTLTVDRARIPANLLIPASGSKKSEPLPFDVALHVNVAAGNDVRVQNGMIDVGVGGHALVGGSAKAPTLAGAFDSTGGTVDLYHDFRLLSGHVAFTPAGGLMPTVNALAETTISDPETDVRMRITGQVPHLDLRLSSTPSYSREQILGLLLGVQALGAVNGVNGTGGSTQSIVSAQMIESQGEGLLAQQLTRNLFAPLSSGLGDALGLSNLQLYLDPTSGFEARASRGIARNLSAIFSQTVGSPSREAVGLRSTPSNGTALQLTFFRESGATGFGATSQTFLQSVNSSSDQTLLTSQPAGGLSGFSLSGQRRF